MPGRRRHRASIRWTSRNSRGKGRIRSRGLAATVLTNSPGQMVLMVRRADAWFARRVRPGEAVQISAAGSEDVATRSDPGSAVSVLDVRPDYSRVRISVRGSSASSETFRRGDLVFISAKIPEVIDLDTPPDLGRKREKEERIDYFLSTIYCPCGMIGTSCAGHWNTLAACKLHACGMPNLMTKQLQKWIEGGKEDSEIFALLRSEHGRQVIAIHQN